MSIESLKQKARKAEQNEDWQKALEHYNKALKELAREEQVDIGLYNRVGDLYVRVGKLDGAVEHYERAVELYREAYLPNNAIAVCKKIIRNVPAHHRAYLVIGQIRAEQGFLPDARTNFLTYAERMQAAGDLDESFRALVEFCDLAPDDVGVRVTVAEQMAASGRNDDAIAQLAKVYRHYSQLGESAQADQIEQKINQIDPDADVDGMSAATGFGDDGSGAGEFGEISVGADAFGTSSDAAADAGFAIAGAMEAAASDEPDVDADLGGFDIQAGEEEVAPDLPAMSFDDDDEGEAVELPMMAFDDDVGAEEEVSDLPTIGFDDDDEGEAVELPMMDVGVDFSDEGALETLPIESEPDASFGGASDGLEEAIEEAWAEPEPVVEHQQPSFAEPEPPVAAEEPVVAEAPPPPTEPAPEKPASPAQGEYVDLGAMILGESQEKSTRFKVAYEEPSGDEEADFAKMLTQFKEKVSENLDSSDVRAHYDLGTAYKEMGLLDEAISSFQAALRASADHLPTYELMGQTFIEMGQPEAAVRSLERAIQSANAVEDELVAIYYYLGRAYEELENRASAVDYYDRVFALDINFADVTERLRELR